MGEEPKSSGDLATRCREVCRVLDEEAYDPTEAPARLWDISRAEPLGSAEAQLASTSREQLLAGLDVRFAGEPAMDAGGVAREFCGALKPELDVLLEALPDGTLTLRRGSSVAAHFAFGRLCGALLAWAARPGPSAPVLDVPLSACLAKLITGARMSPLDVRDVDPVYYEQHLKRALDDLEGLRETVGELVFTWHDGSPLHAGGEHENVTPENVQTYVAETAERYLLGGRRHEAGAFVEGVHGVLGRVAARALDYRDVQLLLVGVRRLDIEAWRDSTRLELGPVTREDAAPLIEAFWTVLKNEFEPEDRARLLLFATGAAALPVGGFDALSPRFTIVLDAHAPHDHLPTAHACFNSLHLPVYPTTVLTKRLRTAIRFGVGFSLS